MFPECHSFTNALYVSCKCKMTLKLYFSLLCLWAATAQGQTHFSKFKAPNYKTAGIQYRSLLEDSMKLDIVDVSHIKGLMGIKIHLQQVTMDSSKILIYKDNKLKQILPLPFMFWHLENECLVADLDGNNKPDIKLTVPSGGAGLAGELTYKIYLFHQGETFRLLSFFDFSHEKEYDLNKDGIYEILSCNHVYKAGHSYWVYNVFNFSNGKLTNVSKTRNYPLWTKHLYTSRDVIATNISQKDRNKEYKALPDQTVIR